MSALALINHHGVDVRIERASITTDTGGGQPKTWGLVRYEKWFIQPSGGSEDIRYGGESTRRFLNAYAPASSAVRDGDRITWNGRTFDIQVHNRAGEFTRGPLAHIVVELEETRADQ